MAKKIKLKLRAPANWRELICDVMSDDNPVMDRLYRSHEARGEDDGAQEGAREVRHGAGRVQTRPLPPGKLGQAILVGFHEGPDWDDDRDDAQGPDADLGDPRKDPVRELVYQDGEGQGDNAVADGYDGVEPRYSDEHLRGRRQGCWYLDDQDRLPQQQ